MTKRMKPFVPEIAELDDRLMAVVRTVGDPDEVLEKAFSALYGAVYGLKFTLKKRNVEYKIEPARARWLGGPEFAERPRDTWEAIWAIPIPQGTVELKQKDPETPVTIEPWAYGEVAQVLHVGTYAEEAPTIRQLHEFIEEQGYEIAGPHEEEYQSRPGPKGKTVIRYQVRKRVS